MFKVVGGLILIAAAGLAPVLLRAGTPAARVHFFDIGQGDSILIEAGRNQQILIDGGPDRTVLQRLGEVMPSFDRRIELVIATHPDLDHYGGLTEVVRRYEVPYLMVHLQDGAEPYEEMLGRVRRRNGLVMAGGQRLKLPHGELEVLDPRIPGQRGPISDKNDASIAVKLRLFDQTFLMAGDAEKAEEARLVRGGVLDSDVLKANHHGSKSSSWENFLTAVRPEWCIISVGRKNRYGHPHPDALERLRRSGCRIARTDQSGTITAEVTRRGMRIKRNGPG